jgi:hypothetical protein
MFRRQLCDWRSVGSEEPLSGAYAGQSRENSHTAVNKYDSFCLVDDNARRKSIENNGRQPDRRASRMRGRMSLAYEQD